MDIVASATAKEIRPSATLIVAAPNKANGHNYKVLMMKRNAKSSFIHAHVFPGGVVDKHDDASLWQPLLKQQPTTELTNKICAIRETFEESGLLLTHPPATAIQDKQVWRERVHNDASQFKVLCETHGLVPAVDRLTPFANWITPGAEKRRYNTHFFLTVWSPDSVAQADGTETVHLDWFSPKEALEQWRQQKIVLFPPQWYSLESMMPIQDHVNLAANAGIGALRTSNGKLSTIMPQHNPVNDPTWSDRGYHTFLAYPGDEYYLDLKHGQPTGQSGDRHRIYIRGRMEGFELEKNVNVPEEQQPSSSSIGKINKASL